MSNPKANSNSLVVVEKARNVKELTTVANLNDMQGILQYGEKLIASGLLPSAYKKPEQVLVAVEKGRSLGINPIEALFGIDVIVGRPTLSAKLVGALVKRAGGYYETVKDFEPIYGTFLDEEGNFGEANRLITAKENNEYQYQPTDYVTTIRFYDINPITKEVSKQDVHYTWSEAVAAGDAGKDNYIKRPGVMLWNRCLTKGVRRVFPEVLSGLYETTEMLDSLNKKDTRPNEERDIDVEALIQDIDFDSEM